MGFAGLLGLVGLLGFVPKGLASQCKAQEKYKERLDSGVTWLK